MLFPSPPSAPPNANAVTGPPCACRYLASSLIRPSMCEKMRTDPSAHPAASSAGDVPEHTSKQSTGDGTDMDASSRPVMSKQTNRPSAVAATTLMPSDDRNLIDVTDLQQANQMG